MPPVAGRPALTVAPSAWLTMTAGIVIVGSTPPIVIGVPGALLATMTPTARAAWALATFTAKPQTLGRRSRSRRAGKPTNVSQPREAPLPLSASRNAPVDPAWLGAGPNPALYTKRNPGVLVDVDVVRRPVTGSVRVRPAKMPTHPTTSTVTSVRCAPSMARRPFRLSVVLEKMS